MVTSLNDTRHTRRAVVMLGGASVCVGGCIPFSSYDFRYRLTLSFVKDGVERSSSSVRRLVIANNPRWLPPGSGQFAVKMGEAAVVDLGAGRKIFGLMSRLEFVDGAAQRWGTLDPAGVIASRTGRDVRLDGSGRDPVLDEALALSTKLILRPEEWPMLAYFGDIRRKETATFLPFSEIGKVFPGVKAGTATIETTHALVTKGQLDKSLPWLRDRPYYLSDRPLVGRNPNVLTMDDFIRQRGPFG